MKKLFGEMQGEQLTRVPKGFTPDHPAADLVRYKQFLLWTELPPGDRHFEGALRGDHKAF